MKFTDKSLWRTILGRAKRSEKLSPAGREVSLQRVNTGQHISDASKSPITKFYDRRIHNNLPSLYTFALRSRSLAIRDVFAKASTIENYDLDDLLAMLEGHGGSQNDTYKKNFREVCHLSTLLALADLLVNTAHDDWDNYAAVVIYSFVLDTYGAEAFGLDQKLLYVEALIEVEQYEMFREVRQALDLDSFAPMQLELLELQSLRQTASLNTWLDEVNRFYVRLGLSKIRINDDTHLPLLDRLESDAVERYDGPKISIIMPTFSPGSGIQTAVRSLLQQTWKNIEIIIVDDASPDEFQELLSQLEVTDSRIRVIRQQENQGAYVARNKGLEVASGTFITVHDDDDWSHPDKLALQIQALQENNASVASSSAHIRTSEEVDFRRINTKPVYLQMNYSSVMFHRTLVDEIGAWDTVNRGADGEFLLRLITNFTSSKIVELEGLPLSFSRIWSGSLTAGEMSRGYFAPSRLLYREAFRQWHRELKRQNTKIVLQPNEPRSFPAPTTFAPGMRNSDVGVFDIIFASDFYRQAKHSDIVISQIEALSRAGLRVGFMQLPSPETMKPAGFPSKLFDMQLSQNVTQVAHTDRARTELLVVYGSAIGMFLDQTKSTVVCERGILVDHELPQLEGSENGSAALLSKSVKNLDLCFATRFEITGAHYGDYQRLRCHTPNNRLLPEDLIWYEIVDAKPASILAPTDVAKVGFNTRGNIYRWPSSATLFELIYKSDEFKTYFMGNTQPAYKKYGDSIFSGTRVFGKGEISENEFLDCIDFWVYHPHHRLTAQPWAPVLKAMQAGKVVILPPHLSNIYGSAAVYADAENVAAYISRLSKDKEAFVDQARRGQDFIKSEFTVQRLLERQQKLVASGTNAAQKHSIKNESKEES